MQIFLKENLQFCSKGELKIKKVCTTEDKIQSFNCVKVFITSEKSTKK